MRLWWITFVLIPGLLFATSHAGDDVEVVARPKRVREAQHPVDQLAQLTAAPSKADALGFWLAECPILPSSPKEIDLRKLGPPITIAKLLNESTWEWQEYPLLGSDATCVLLLSPRREALSKDHASILTMHANDVLPRASVNHGIRFPGNRYSSSSPIRYGPLHDNQQPHQWISLRN